LFGAEDEVTGLVLKASTVSATTTTSGWAAELAAASVADVVVGLGPISAAAALIGLTTHVDFPPGVAYVTVPGQVMTAFDGGAFVAEGAPIPARKFNIDQGATLALRKAACIVEITRELATYSGFEPVVRQMIGKAIGLLR
jgi:hypothetical protein